MTTQYAIRYYRDKTWAERFRNAGWPGKPVGWHLSTYRYEKREDAIHDVMHINKQGPKYPVELVVLWNGIERT